ncbi:MAG TPA: D-glycero-beta-D-manno-heptose 1-phosphate adenylyltransferase [Caulobacteraceae bacterium]|nr:D-glycero-beta-D-manno-heptose 1-phosphate adenylyltransferase [Caulobacteraceae bacterium]
MRGKHALPMDLSALQRLLAGVAGTRVLAVGDLMVDRFVYGEVSRVSAEAPVPILARQRDAVMLGAVGNVARNLAALGAEASLVGVIGADGPAAEAMKLAAAEPLIEGFLVPDKSRATTTKTRFICGGQQLLRVDHEDTCPIAAELEQRLSRTIRDAARGAGAILVSDYGKGVVTEAVIAACLEAGRAQGAPIIVDSKAKALARYGQADVIKPNAAELARITDMPTETDTDVETALTQALALCAAGAILVTRAGKGMSLGVRGEGVRHFHAAPAAVFDASGAGDTALAALGAALAARAPMELAIDFALLASGVAVEKPGTATVTPDELIEALLAAHLAPAEAKIVTADRAAAETAGWRERGLKVGFTNGCFDILHPGHIAYLTQARTWCDRLIVALNSDASVRRVKGEGRPVNTLEARALVVAALGCVDLVAPFEEATPEALIRQIRPDILVKGGDYRPDEVVGRELVESWGGEVRIAAFVDGHSTTAAIERAKARA